MRDTRLDILASLLGLRRGEFAPGDYEDDEGLARRIHVAARHGPSRGAIATMGVTIGDPEAAQGRRSGSPARDAGSGTAPLYPDGGTAGGELACIFCHRPGRVRAAGFAPECDACASS